MGATLEGTILATLGEGPVVGGSYSELQQQLAPEARLCEFQKALGRLLAECQVVWRLSGDRGLGCRRQITIAAVS